METKGKKVINWVEKYLSWIIAVGGLGLSAYGLLGGNQFTNIVVYLMIVLDTLILLGLGIYIGVSCLRNNKMNEESKRKEEQQKREIESLEVEIEKQKKAFLILESNDNYIIRTLHKFLERLYGLTDEVFDEIENIKNEENEMKNHNYTDEEIENKIVALTKEKNEKFSAVMYDDYKRFLSNILSKTQESIEIYLQTKGYEFEVSVTIKQFIKPCDLNGNKDYITKPYVYTAFRDSRTWGRKIRNEVAEKLYIVEKNSDFIHCMSQGYFIFNNKSISSRDYCNENTEFDKHYNCGVTTLIASPKGKKKIGYGFLACDVLNKKHLNEEIMDSTVAQILDTTSDVIVTYFDNIDFNWFLCQVSEEFASFWEMVYKNYLVEI